MLSNSGNSNIRQLNNTLHINHIIPLNKDGHRVYAINAMREFKGKSLEELRNEDYNFLDDPDSLSNFDRQALEAKIAGTSFNFFS